LLTRSVVHHYEEAAVNKDIDRDKMNDDIAKPVDEEITGAAADDEFEDEDDDLDDDADEEDVENVEE
jgi:hypothetical protein